MKNILEIINWWENLDCDTRNKLLENGWKGDREERHERLRKIYENKI